MGFYREGKPVKVGDKTYPSMSAWSRACGLSMGCLIYRLSKGMTPEEAEDQTDYREAKTGGIRKPHERVIGSQPTGHKRATGAEELKNLITKGSRY